MSLTGDGGTRAGTEADLEQVAAIQAACPEAAQWPVHDYLSFDFRVAMRDGRVAGFAVSRVTAPEERELLNLAVDPNFRRLGAGAELVRWLTTFETGNVFLEVRESNEKARAFYQALGFQQVGVRPNYYQAPDESCIVMKFHSC